MRYTKVCVCVFLLYFVFDYHQCLKVIPERAEVVYYNKLYFEDTPIFNVRRYSRKGEYVMNLFFTSKKVLDNTISVHMIFYQYLHNEYRRSFPELHFKLCDLINDDDFIGKSIRDGGWNTCPMEPGSYASTNISFNYAIPSVWPYEKGMIEFINTNLKGILLAKGVVVVTFQQNILKNIT